MPWSPWSVYNRAPSERPVGTSGHSILTGRGAVGEAVIRRARDAGVPYVILEPDRSTALTLHDDGYPVMVGDLDSPDAYRRARVEKAALVAPTRTDLTNTNNAFTVRGVSEHGPKIGRAARRGREGQAG